VAKDGVESGKELASPAKKQGRGMAIAMKRGKFAGTHRGTRSKTKITVALLPREKVANFGREK